MNNNKKESKFGYEAIYTLILIAAGIVVLVALCLSGNIANYAAFNVLMVIGCGMYVAAAVMALVKSVTTLFGKINHRAPEYKRAITITIVMGLIFAVALLGFIWAITLL